VFRFEGFELDQQRAELRGPDGRVIKLRPKSFEMLRLLAEHAGRVLSKQELMEAVWPNLHVGEDSLFQCIREIRGALGDDRRQMIRLVSGRGYLLAAEVSREGTAGATEPETPLAVDETVTAEPAPLERPFFGRRRPAVIAGLAALAVVVAVAIAAWALGPDLIVRQRLRTIIVMPIADLGQDAQGDMMATAVTDRLTDGFARIDNIRVLARPADVGGERSDRASAGSAPVDFVVRGELQRGPQGWTLQARMIRTATGEVQSVATTTVDIRNLDLQLQQSRLAAGVGHQLAQNLNRFLDAEASPAGGSTKVVIEQATASINQSTRERFGMAQTMLQNALAAEPDNLDIAVALAGLQMRGIQMVWFSPAEALAAEEQATATLERALRAKPNSIPVLEAYCRLLSATNRFVDSLVACARALNFDPWNGLALYLVGLGQLHLGRFEDALATFQQADRFDTPQVSRWTWLLGTGWAYVMLERYEEALPWLQRSITITPASGRSHMTLAVAYVQLGRLEEARAAMRKGLELRAGTTARNVLSPTRNASPRYIERADWIVRQMVAAGLPEN
jgi:DNA-binding winged helix-turn-helix (wHTH) protein/tetratricopeptide (TPR) repeat protein